MKEGVRFWRSSTSNSTREWHELGRKSAIELVFFVAIVRAQRSVIPAIISFLTINLLSPRFLFQVSPSNVFSNIDLENSPQSVVFRPPLLDYHYLGVNIIDNTLLSVK